MIVIRRLLARQGWLAACLVAATLLVRLTVPAGYMPMAGSAALMICPDQGTMPPAMVMMPGGMHHHDKGEHGKAEQPCAFAGIAAPSLAATEMPSLAPTSMPVVPPAHVLPHALAPPQRSFLRPPLRGPPTLG